MKNIKLKKSIIAGLAVAGLALTAKLHADVSLFLEGGSASQSVLYNRATNLFAGGSFTTYPAGANSKTTVIEFKGTSLNPLLTGAGTITFDYNVANGAVAGLQALATQAAGPGDTNYAGITQVPDFVDSATSPDAVGISSTAAHLGALPTYVVPLVFVKNTNYPVVNSITNLTSRQAVQLETTLLPATFFGGNATNLIYFVGRNLESAVRTEIDANIFNTLQINTYATNGAGLPVLDTSADPGLSSAGLVVNNVLAITNSIGTVAVQNITTGLASIPIDGVPYSPTNVINGSYSLWGYENYYYITTGNAGALDSAKQTVLNVFYSSVTNAAFQVSSVFTNNFIPNSSLRVSRHSDGGPITPLPGY